MASPCLSQVYGRSKKQFTVPKRKISESLQQSLVDQDQKVSCSLPNPHQVEDVQASITSNFKLSQRQSNKFIVKRKEKTVSNKDSSQEIPNNIPNPIPQESKNTPNNENLHAVSFKSNTCEVSNTKKKVKKKPKQKTTKKSKRLSKSCPNDKSKNEGNNPKVFTQSEVVGRTLNKIVDIDPVSVENEEKDASCESKQNVEEDESQDSFVMPNFDIVSPGVNKSIILKTQTLDGQSQKQPTNSNELNLNPTGVVDDITSCAKTAIKFPKQTLQPECGIDATPLPIRLEARLENNETSLKLSKENLSDATVRSNESNGALNDSTLTLDTNIVPPLTVSEGKINVAPATSTSLEQSQTEDPNNGIEVYEGWDSEDFSMEIPNFDLFSQNIIHPHSKEDMSTDPQVPRTNLAVVEEQPVQKEEQSEKHRHGSSSMNAKSNVTASNFDNDKLIETAIEIFESFSKVPVVKSTEQKSKCKEPAEVNLVNNKTAESTEPNNLCTNSPLKQIKPNNFNSVMRHLNINIIPVASSGASFQGEDLTQSLQEWVSSGRQSAVIDDPNRTEDVHTAQLEAHSATESIKDLKNGNQAPSKELLNNTESAEDFLPDLTFPGPPGDVVGECNARNSKIPSENDQVEMCALESEDDSNSQLEPLSKKAKHQSTCAGLTSNTDKMSLQFTDSILNQLAQSSEQTDTTSIRYLRQNEPLHYYDRFVKSNSIEKGPVGNNIVKGLIENRSEFDFQDSMSFLQSSCLHNFSQTTSGFMRIMNYQKQAADNSYWENQTSKVQDGAPNPQFGCELNHQERKIYNQQTYKNVHMNGQTFITDFYRTNCLSKLYDKESSSSTEKAVNYVEQDTSVFKEDSTPVRKIVPNIIGANAEVTDAKRARRHLMPDFDNEKQRKVKKLPCANEFDCQLQPEHGPVGMEFQPHHYTFGNQGQEQASCTDQNGMNSASHGDEFQAFINQQLHPLKRRNSPFSNKHDGEQLDPPQSFQGDLPSYNWHEDDISIRETGCHTHDRHEHVTVNDDKQYEQSHLDTIKQQPPFVSHDHLPTEIIGSEDPLWGGQIKFSVPQCKNEDGHKQAMLDNYHLFTANIQEGMQVISKNDIFGSCSSDDKAAGNVAAVLAFDGKDFTDYVKKEELRVPEAPKKSKWSDYVNNDLYEPKMINMRGKWIDNIVKQEKDTNITGKFLRENDFTKTFDEERAIDSSRYESLTQPVDMRRKEDHISQWLENCNYEMNNSNI